MATNETQEVKARKSKDNSDDDLGYENESYVANLPGETIVPNGGFPTDITTAKNVATKWTSLVKTRRLDRHVSMSLTDGHGHLQPSYTLGLDEEITDTEANVIGDTSQRRLNKRLISHFVKLARNNHTEDEVDLDFIEELLSEGANINCCDKHGQGMLHEAARAWHTDIVLFLLKHGADVNLADNFNRTALHIAAAVDYPDMVEVLVENGAHIEAVTKVENQTPLHFAARNDAVESLKVLIKLGAEIEARDYKSRTPIFVAAELDRSETAKFLLEVNADATVVDCYGQICMTHMITKMGPVARTALDQFHRKDRANRRQYFYLSLLESTREKKGNKTTLAKTPLEVIVNYRQLDLIMHPVIMRLIDVKWNQFGRRVAFRTLLLNFVFILIWTILGVGVPWYTRYLYTFPQDWWRVFLLVLGFLLTVYYVVKEVKEILNSRKGFKTWKLWREKQIQEDLTFCHPKWPEEEKYLRREFETLDDMLPSYFQDFWNYFDWAVYFFIFLSVLLHIIDVALTPATRAPPCCEVVGNTTICSVDVCAAGGYVNNANLGVWNNRIFVITIIFLWLRLMKFTRAFRFLGPFIVMLGKIVWDIMRFFYLYLEFYIPYACAFWMIFGNVSSIDSMFTVDQMLFSLYRITLVDDYQFDEMRAFDVVMAYILIGTFLGVSAILCLNLFIALLSDTFQRVYDNANANAVMQQAALMLTIEENLSKRSKKQLTKYIESKCSPESMYYDDDLTVAQDADLKKATIQIREQMNELMDIVHKAESENRMAFDDRLDMPHQLLEENEKRQNMRRESVEDSDYNTPRGGRLKPNKTSLRITDVLGLKAKMNSSGGDGQGSAMSNEAMQKMSTKMIELSSRLQRLQISQTAQEESYRRLRGDMKDIKKMLRMLLPPGQAIEEADEDDWREPGRISNKQLFSSPPISMSSVAHQLTEQQSSDGNSAGGMLKRLFGGNKTVPKKGSGMATSPSQSVSVPPLHVVDMSAQAPSQSSRPTNDVHGHTEQATVAGVRTAEVVIRDPSDQNSADHVDGDNNQS